MPDLGLVPLTDTPEATFEMIAAANLQPETPQECDSAPDLQDEESAEELEPQSEPEEDIDLGPVEDEKEILLAEVFYYHVFSLICQVQTFNLHLGVVGMKFKNSLWCFRRQWHQQSRSPDLLRLQLWRKKPTKLQLQHQHRMASA